MLDALNHIKDQMDGTLSYRWSCRMGVCGSCGMMVNGVPKLTCAAFLRDYYPQEIRVEPLINFPDHPRSGHRHERFHGQAEEREALDHSQEEKPVSRRRIPTNAGRARGFQQFTQCINCMLCYAACPVYGLEPKFLGPAAIALGYRYNMDSRDQGKDQREDHRQPRWHLGMHICRRMQRGLSQSMWIPPRRSSAPKSTPPRTGFKSYPDALGTTMSGTRPDKSKLYHRKMPATWWLKKQSYLLSCCASFQACSSPSFWSSSSSKFIN